MHYREFDTITDEEIAVVTQDILGLGKPVFIKRLPDRAVMAGIETMRKDTKTGKNVAVRDNVLMLPIKRGRISLFLSAGSITYDNWTKAREQYEKYLLSLGMHWLLKDNPYLKED